MMRSAAVMEFVSFAVAEVRVREAGVYILEVTGSQSIWVLREDGNGAGVWQTHAADQYGRGLAVGVRLAAGINLLALKLRGVAQAQARIRSVRLPPNAPAVRVTKMQWVADLVCDRRLARLCEFYLGNAETALSFTVQNLDAASAIKTVTAQIEPGSPAAAFLRIVEEGGDFEPASFCDDDVDLIDGNPVARQMLCDNAEARRQVLLPAFSSVAPLSTRALSRRIAVKDKHAAFDACGGGRNGKLRAEVVVPVLIRADGGLEQHRLVYTVRCRDLEHDSFLISYVDFDGSPAHAALVLPLMMRANVSSASSDVPQHIPVMNTLHGTGVSATSQVDAHKRAPKMPGVFVFGSDELLLIMAPSRAGAHNHEFVGAHHNAFAPLLISAVARRRSSGVNSKAHKEEASDVSPLIRLLVPDVTRGLVCSGHSMGSRGAMVLATQMLPNFVVGLLLLGAWIEKEKYGESNAIFSEFDRSTDFIGHAERGVIAASVADQGLTLENLRDVPVLLRTGAHDGTTPPYHARRLARLLKQAGVRNVTYSEPIMTLDGPAGHWWWSTTKRDDGGVVFDAVIRRGIKRMLAGAEQQAVSSAETATFVSYSPHTTAVSTRGACRKLRLLAQIVPATKSSITVACGSNGGDAPLVVAATNVRRVEVDGVELCLGAAQRLERCSATQQRQQHALPRKPFSPLRAYAHAPFFVGALSLSANSAAAAAARYYSDTHAVAYESDAPVVELADAAAAQAQLKSRRGLIVACLEEEGEQRLNAFLAAVAVRPTLRVARKWIEIDGRRVVGSQLALLTIFAGSGSDSRGGVLVVAQTRAALAHISNFVAHPVPPPMLRPAFGNLLPDFSVVDTACGAGDGYGAFIAAGFFEDDSMLISVRMSYVREDLVATKNSEEAQSDL